MDKFNKEDKVSYTELASMLQRNIDEIKSSMEKLWGSTYDNEKSREDMSFSDFKDELNKNMDDLKKYTEYIAKTATPVGAIIPFAGTVAQLKEILDTGEYYICDGTKGTPNLVGRYVQGGTADTLGRYIPAGLPNIWGRIVQGNWSNNYTNGAFYQPGDMGGPCAHKGDPRYLAYMDASRCSPVYGRSNTVTPETYVIVWLMRVVKLSDDIVNVSILQTSGQIISVKYLGKDYVSSFQASKNNHVKITLTPLNSNYTIGKIIVNETEYDSNTVELSITDDLIITATAATKTNLEITIEQTEHQTITVTCDDVQYTSDFVIPKNTSYTVSITADEGYIAGTLSTTEGIFTEDTVITATAAQSIITKRIFKLSKMSAAGNGIVLVINNSDIYYSHYTDDPLEIEVEDGSPYFVHFFGIDEPSTPSGNFIKVYRDDGTQLDWPERCQGVVSENLWFKI